MIRLGLFAFLIFSSATTWADSVHVCFGTDTDESQGIDRAALDTTSGAH